MTASCDPGYARLLKRQQRYDRRRLVLLGLLLLAALVFSLSAGEIWLWPTRWLSDDARLFIWQLRLPRTLAVVLVGASLGMAGAVMQGIFDNPLSEPGLLGVANGAGMTLALAVLLGGGRLPVWVLWLSAVAGALLMTLALLTFARRQASNARLLLTGVALGILCGAVMTWLIYFSSSLDLRQLLYWLMGGFSGVDWRDKWLMLSLLPFLFWLGRCGRVLNLLALGEASVQQLGLPVYFWRTSFVLAFGWMVGISVALAGAISFIGLVVPHILRLWGLNDHRALLPGCALASGGILLLAAVMLQVWPTLNADARLLLLDEPAASLDIAQQVALDQLIALLTAAGLSVLMCAHDINHTLQHADEVWLMAQGELVAAGTAADVMIPELLAKVFTVSFSKVSAGGRRWLVPCGE